MILDPFVYRFLLALAVPVLAMLGACDGGPTQGPDSPPRASAPVVSLDHPSDPPEPDIVEITEEMLDEYARLAPKLTDTGGVALTEALPAGSSLTPETYRYIRSLEVEARAEHNRRTMRSNRNLTSAEGSRGDQATGMNKLSPWMPIIKRAFRNPGFQDSVTTPLANQLLFQWPQMAGGYHNIDFLDRMAAGFDRQSKRKTASSTAAEGAMLQGYGNAIEAAKKIWKRIAEQGGSPTQQDVDTVKKAMTGSLGQGVEEWSASTMKERKQEQQFELEAALDRLEMPEQEVLNRRLIERRLGLMPVSISEPAQTVTRPSERAASSRHPANLQNVFAQLQRYKRNPASAPSKAHGSNRRGQTPEGGASASGSTSGVENYLMIVRLQQAGPEALHRMMALLQSDDCLLMQCVDKIKLLLAIGKMGDEAIHVIPQLEGMKGKFPYLADTIDSVISDLR